ncbi:MAG: CDP-diacylglycerol--glycerol-3-phosphate 3-phosphatidyltransferase, partial [Turicibacter sp.]|nr:CDP-diacylglycerol--glycerol-3-phosphate 3-phosphatidyltransferase [Turicibacter sp.]
MNIANKLTVWRIILIPFFLICFYVTGLSETYLRVGGLELPYSHFLGLIIFLVAAVTDFFDGYLARKHNMITNFGKFMDPLADKLLVTAAFLVFIELGLLPGWAVFIILAREFMVTGLRTLAAAKGVIMAAGW